MARLSQSLMAFLAALLVAWPAWAAPKVLVSIAPLHSLAASVMAGVGAPDLLLDGHYSPHGYSLIPSQAMQLRQANLVVWVGSELESFMAKPIAALADKSKILAMSDVEGMTILEAREGGPWEPHADEAEHEHGGNELEIDGHMWLDPVNAALFADALAERLAGIDPSHAPQYRKNALELRNRLSVLDAELKAELSPLAGRPYIVFHDAYHYFERRYGLTPLGSITVDPERKPSAQTIARLRKKIVSLKASCVFREPQFSPALVETVAKGLPVKIGVLDVMASQIPPGPELYGALMNGLAEALKRCLAD